MLEQEQLNNQQEASLGDKPKGALDVYTNFNEKVTAGYNHNHEIEKLILDTHPKLGFFHCFTGGGKTAQALELISNILCNSYKNGKTTEYNIKFIYATMRIQEVCEGLMRLHTQMVEEKGIGNYSKFLNNLFVRFDKSSISYKDAIVNIKAQIDNGSPFSSKDVKWIETFIQEDVDHDFSKKALKRLFKARVIITTHASLPTIGAILGKKCADYSVFIDEIPFNFFRLSDVTENDTFEADVQQMMKSNCKVEEFQKASALAKQFKLGLLSSIEKNGVRTIHFNLNHPFKSMILSSASGCDVVLLNEIYGFEYIKVYHSVLNQGLIDSGKANLELVEVPFEPDEKVLNVTTSTHLEGLENAIATNLTGVNSLSGFNNVELHGEFTLPADAKSRLVKLFGDNADAVEFMIFKDRLLQSIYRSCIRKGEKVRVYAKNRRQIILVNILFECCC